MDLQVVNYLEEWLCFVNQTWQQNLKTVCDQ
uniref:Uncharacterized protein n=1 Tax=Anguilla anguilla TaxID=7936 RepID=A0A0E9XCD0_ANGAN